MSDPFDCMVVFSDTDHVLNRESEGTDISWGDYDTVRSQLAHVCAHYGTVGPYFGDESLKKHVSDDPLYWIVADQYNADDKFVFVNIMRRSGLTVDWIRDVARMVASTDGWAVSVGFDDGFFIVYPDRIVVGGEMFRGCSSPDEVVSFACRADTWD